METTMQREHQRVPQPQRPSSDAGLPEPQFESAIGNAGMLERLRDAGPPSHDDEGGFGVATRGSGGGVPYLALMERAFGQDFGGVRAHLGGDDTERGLGEIGADAAASGDVVAFSSSTPSVEQVAHELCHVVQTRGARQGVRADGAVSRAADGSEEEARRVGRAVAATGEAPAITEAPTAAIHRDGPTMTTRVQPVPPDVSHLHPVELDRDTRLLCQIQDRAVSGWSTSELLELMEVEGFRSDDHRAEVEAELVRRAPQFGVAEVLAMRSLTSRSLVYNGQAWRGAERARTAALLALLAQHQARQAEETEEANRTYHEDYELAQRCADADRRMATRPALPTGLSPARFRRIDRLTAEIVRNTVDPQAELDTLRRMNHAGPMGVLVLTVHALSGRGSDTDSVSRALAVGEPLDAGLMMVGGALEARSTAQSTGAPAPESPTPEVRPHAEVRSEPIEARRINALRGPNGLPHDQVDSAGGSALRPAGDRTATPPPETDGATVAPRSTRPPTAAATRVDDDERPTPVMTPVEVTRTPIVPHAELPPLHTTLLPGERDVITADEARTMMGELRELRMPDGAGGETRVAYAHPEDGCYDRAHVMGNHLRSRGVASDKIFVVSRQAGADGAMTGGLNVASEFARDTADGGARPNVRWQYHVAPVVRVRGADGVVREMVFDPSMSSEPMSVAEWTGRMAPGRVFARLSVEDIRAMRASGVTGPDMPVPDGMDATFTAHRRAYYPNEELEPRDSATPNGWHAYNQPQMQEYAATAIVRELAGSIRRELAGGHVSADAIIRAIQANPTGQRQFRSQFPSLMRDVETAVTPADWARIQAVIP
jgi:hypothetical protein